ncbi:MAG: AAA family ATPase [Elusimicrobia bacterium]|nr:AAA family ATPase [Elusimicrobiota bacterium]
MSSRLASDVPRSGLSFNPVNSVKPIDGEIGPKIEMTPEFREALELLHSTKQNLFITGRAGTGKSTLLHLFKGQASKKCVVLAPTGIAALNVRGQTLHSFFGFPPHFMDPKDVKRAGRNRRAVQELETLVIDEASMVRADLLDAMDVCMRLTRGVSEPFGGAQVVLFGDLFQLPPVVEPGLNEIFSQRYSGPYFFDSNAWREMNATCFELRKVFRQGSDPEFLSLLDRLRDNTATREDFARLNQRVEKTEGGAREGLVLSTTNAISRVINDAEMDRLKGKARCYEGVVTGEFDPSSFPTDLQLVLKKGAQVLLLRNDPSLEWVNGDLGKIVGLSEESIQVEIKGKRHELTPVSWERYVYVFDEKAASIKKKVVGTFQQFPVRLAWAITIHKSQGQTFECATIDLGNGAFAHGQAYVAFSRCKTLSGVTLRRPVRPRDLICDDRVRRFHESARTHVGKASHS